MAAGPLVAASAPFGAAPGHAGFDPDAFWHLFFQHLLRHGCAASFNSDRGRLLARIGALAARRGLYTAFAEPPPAADGAETGPAPAAELPVVLYDPWRERDLSIGVRRLIYDERPTPLIVGPGAFGFEQQRRRFAEQANGALEVAIAHLVRLELEQAMDQLRWAQGYAERAQLGESWLQTMKSMAAARIDVSVLVTLARNNHERALLRDLLRQFPRWHVRPLLRRLAAEPSRQSRRQLLELLLVHGGETRREATSLLMRGVLDDGHARGSWYLTRNLIYLLRTLMVEQGDTSDLELASVISYADLEQPTQVFGEATAYLSRTQDPRANARLTTLLERSLALRRSSPRDDELERRLVVVLERMLRTGDAEGRMRALGVVLDEREFTPALAGLLRGLGSLNLMGHATLVDLLVSAGRRALRRPLFSRLFRRPESNDRLQAILAALAGTPLPQVRALVEEAAGRGTDAQTRMLAASVAAQLATAVVVR